MTDVIVQWALQDAEGRVTAYVSHPLRKERAPDGFDFRPVPLAEQRSGPPCGDPDCRLQNLLIVAHLSPQARERYETKLMSGELTGGFVPRRPVSVTRAEISFSRLVQFDSTVAAALLDINHPKHIETYQWVTAIAESHEADGGFIRTAVADTVIIFFFTRLVGQTVLITGERTGTLEPLPLSELPATTEPARPPLKQTARRLAMLLAKRLVGPFAMGLAAKLIDLLFS